MRTRFAQFPASVPLWVPDLADYADKPRRSLIAELIAAIDWRRRRPLAALPNWPHRPAPLTVKLILFGESSLTRSLTQFTEPTERNHQGKRNVLLFADAGEFRPT